LAGLGDEYRVAKSALAALDTLIAGCRKAIRDAEGGA
jgi:hypothetical protein